MVKKDRITPSIEAAFRHTINTFGAGQKADYGGYRTNPNERFAFTRLGRLIDVDYASNTGTVLWIDQFGTRDEVPICHPYLGFRGHMMAMPELNSLVIVGFLHGIRPYIQSYLPFNYPLMVQLTQFPDQIEDVNYNTEQFIKTHAELRQDFDLNSLTGAAIQGIKQLEIETRISNTRLEEYSISKPLLQCGEIDIQSVYGAEIRWDENITINDMNLDEIKLQASDNSIHVTSMHWIKNTEFGTTVEGQVRRPFPATDLTSQSTTNSDPFNVSGQTSLLDAVVDPIMDNHLIPIGANGRLDVTNDQLQGPGFELVYQMQVLHELPFTEKQITVNEFSANSVFAQGQANFIPLPMSEWFTIQKATITRQDSGPANGTTSSGIVQFNIQSNPVQVKFVVDTDTFRPIENRFTTFRPQLQDAAFTLNQDDLFSRLSELLSLNKSFFSQMYQSLVEIPSNKSLADTTTRQQDASGQSSNPQTAPDSLPSGNTPTDQLTALRNQLRSKIAGEQLGFLSDDNTINQSFGQNFAGEELLTQSTGQGANQSIPPIGPLLRITTGTLVDGHDRTLKDSQTFEAISFQIRQQTGMFANIDRRGSINVNATNLLVNTVGMSFKSGFIERNILETYVSDKYNPTTLSGGAKPNVKIYLPEPIPTNTQNNAGRVLEITPTDSSNGSDPRDRTPSNVQSPPINFYRSEIGQIPATPESILPTPDESALQPAPVTQGPAAAAAPTGMAGCPDAPPVPAPGSSTQKTNPIEFLNEFQIKIPKNAKIKPRNDIVDPNIVGYDAPRTKELDLYSFQVDKRFYEFYNPILVSEDADLTKLDREAAFVEISAANVVDRDGTVIRSSMTQNPIAFDLSVNVNPFPSPLSATLVVDQNGSIDASHNNIYHSFNAGFIDCGLVYKVTQNDESVEVRTEAQNQGNQPSTASNASPNNVQPTTAPPLTTVKRQAYTVAPYNNLGQISFKVNASATEGVRTAVKTPEEIEKLTKYQKVEDRTLTAPFQNIPQHPDVELNLGAVVDGNHSQAVTESIGFLNNKLHYRVKKIANALANTSAVSAQIAQVATGATGAPAALTQAVTTATKTQTPQEGVSYTQAVGNELTGTLAAIVGPQQDLLATGTNPALSPITAFYSSVQPDPVAAQNIQANAQSTQQEQNILNSTNAALIAMGALGDSIAATEARNQINANIVAANSQPRDLKVVPNTVVSGLLFPVGFGPSPASEVKVGTTVIGSSSAKAIAATTDPRFPAGAVIANNGAIVSGQGAFSGGTARNPSTGELFSGSAFGAPPLGGGSTVGANGAIVQNDIPILNRITPSGILAPYPLTIPLGTIVGDQGVFVSMPSPGQPNNPNNNPKSLNPVFINQNLQSSNQLTFASKAITTSDLGAVPTSLPPVGVTPSQDNITAIPALSSPTDGTGNGTAGTSPQTTIIEIDNVGNWACKSDVTGVNQTIINSAAQLQLGIVYYKDQNNNLTAAQSVLGPISHARLSLNDETGYGSGLDLDAAGNLIAYATNDFLIKANRRGEIRTYSDLNIISDMRSVSIQAAGGPVLPDSQTGTMVGGLQSTPTAEFVVGRLEERSGPNAFSPILSKYQTEINVAMVRHFDSTHRAILGIDAQGNFIWENNLNDMTNMINTPNGSIAVDRVVDFKAGKALGVIDVVSPILDQPTKLRLKTNGTNPVETHFDVAGNQVTTTSNKYVVAATNYADISSANDAVYVTSQDVHKTSFANLSLGPIKNRTGNNIGQPTLGVFNNPDYVVLTSNNTSVPGTDRTLEFDSLGNAALFSTGSGTTMLIGQGEGTIQLGNVVNFGNNNTVTPAMSTIDATQNIQFRVRMTNGDTRIEMDAAGNQYINTLNKYVTTSTNSTDISSSDAAVYVTSGYDNQGAFFGNMSVGPICKRVGNPLTSSTNPENGIFNEQIYAVLRSANNNITGSDRTFAFDSVGNAALFSSGSGTTMLFGQQEGVMQLGKVVDISGNNITNAVSHTDGSNVNFRIQLANGSLLEIDENGNGYLFLPGKLTIESIGDLNMSSSNGNVSISAPTGNVSVSAASNVSISAPTITRSGVLTTFD